ncbi:MAG: membrane protein insertion efficiency factor YidD [Clostridiales bacterium]|nr:membrane protein insertion efficiency factor YidD [Clostridiales bacterium]
MWHKLVNIVTLPIKGLLILLIKLYQWCISPLLPKTCRFYPSCSKYMILAIKEWGVLRGLWLGTKRIFRCRPGGKCGEDFVPLNIKGELKWIY